MIGLLGDYFSEADLTRITECVRQAEFKTSGEIQVKIREHLGDGVKNIYEQAERDFEIEGLAKTKDKTGILVLVVLGGRKFQILADQGIYRKLPQFYLDNCAKDLASRFGEGEYVNGICETVKSLGVMLVKYFPRRPDDINELPDDVIIGG